MNRRRGASRAGIVALCLWEIVSITACTVALWTYWNDPIKDVRDSFGHLNDYLAQALVAAAFAVAGVIAFFTIRWVVRGFFED